MADKNKFRFSIDRGGTFTDIYAEIPAPPGFMTMKLLSEDPDNYADAAVEGIRRIMEKVTGKKLRQNCLDLSQTEWIRMGTTLATNALLERKGARTGLVITKGFGDLLQIGYQNRPDIFDLRIRKPPMLYEAVVEVNERVRVVKSGEVADRAGITGEGIEVLKKPDLAIVQKCFEELYNKGIKSVAVVLMNSYTFPDHEKLIGSLARSMGFEHVSLSHEVMPSVRIVGRGDTTTMDAYLTPKIMEYIASFRQGFCGELQGCKVLFMQSYGGLIEADKFTGARAILSGPAGGVVGYAATCFDQETRQGVIGFDMGGTSTDVSRYSGEYELVHETETAGIRVHAPQMHIVTVAAGGGSRLFYESGRFQVGPESTGAHPGPVCYCKSGDLAITDANLVLGRLNPEFFPKIFGPNHDQPLDKEGAWQVLERLYHKINQDRSEFPPMTVEETALGFIEVANETMARAIRQISVMRGYDIKEHVLACFGGAGGQHACSLARRLGISRVRIHRFAGIMSAYGLGLADVVREIQAPAAQTLNAETMERLESRFNELEANAVQELQHEGFSASNIQVNRYLNLRYKGTSTAVMIQASDSGYETAFREAHTQEYGFDFKDKAIVIDDIRVRAVGKAEPIERRKIERSSEPPLPAATMKTYFESGWADTKVYLMDNLKAGHRIYGPALVMQNDATIVVEPDCMAEVTDYGDMDIVIPQAKSTNVSTESDPVQLSIFNNLFMSIAEQMGRTLQRTSISTNIKERLDFSCAVFDCQGNLIANAPHIPVHLGSMSEAVKKQIELLGKDLQRGDVIVSNDPNFGGTHLPDITVITPVFVRGEILFFLASRGHHADIGGITPGSIPPLSTTLAEEGVCIRSFKLVKKGVFQEQEIRRILGSAYEAMTSKGKRCISGCRNLEDNISDLKAQVAANNRGLSLLLEMADHYGT